MDLRKLLKQMSMEEKIGQLTQYNANLFIDSEAGITGPMAEAGLDERELKTVGSVLNFRSAGEAFAIQREHMEEDPNQIPIVFMMDVIHGYRTIFPIPLALGCSFDTELVAECTRMAAAEASAAGVHVTFSPMVDYVRDARWGRVMETCGEEPMLNGLMGATQVKAFRGEDLESQGTLGVCVKHFAAYGGAEAGRDYNTVELSEHCLREYYLPAYKACLDAGADMIMPSFNTLNGVPSTVNPWLMKHILREEWGYDGLVISDYSAIAEVVKHGIADNLKDAARMAFENGCHIEMCSNGYIKHLKELIEEGIFSEEQLDEAVLKVLELKERLGLFKDPYRGATPEREKEVCLTKANRKLVRRAAAESAVLLKNEGILPLSKRVKKIALIGPFADEHAILGFWHCRGMEVESVTVKQGIEAMLPDAEVLLASGCSACWDDVDKSGFEEAVLAARNADAVILCLGEPQNYSGEGNSRVSLELPGVQNELTIRVAEANVNTVAVLFTGRPLAITALKKHVPAILNMWFPGTEGGNAVAELLFGDVNPSGKLSMTFPKSVGQCPIYYNHTNTGRPKQKEDDERHIPYHSNYIDCGNLPLYSFGHGLSYSDFVYEDLVLSKNCFLADETVTATVRISNRSVRKGKETVMLYMRDVTASNSRPIQQLIGFKKIEFQAGETKEVVFIIREELLRFWNNEQKFIAEPGTFLISTGYADHLLHTRELIYLEK